MATPVTEEEKLAQRSAEAAGGIVRNMPKMQQPEDTEEDVVEENGTYSRKDAALRGNSTTNGVTAPQPQLTITEKRESQPTLEDIERATHPHETDEQKAAREKREKRNKLLATIGDGLAAFHEAYEMNRGRKPIVQVGLSERMQKYYDQMRLQRERREREYNNALLRARMADEANKQRGIANQIAARRQERLERETAIKEERNDAYNKWLIARANKDDATAERYRKIVERYDDEMAASIGVKQSQINKNNSAANLDDVRAAAGGFANTAGGMKSYNTKRWKNGKLVEETQRTVNSEGSSSPQGGGNEGKRPDPLKPRNNNANPQTKKNPLMKR